MKYTCLMIHKALSKTAPRIIMPNHTKPVLENHAMSLNFYRNLATLSYITQFICYLPDMCVIIKYTCLIY